ncbi:MAG TPA: LamG domain-containing protein [Chitinophagaceae bacterium]|jgi:hypothetical protein|nr:LamG domain-containing protein [Chitinophagaceae bacterium]
MKFSTVMLGTAVTALTFFSCSKDKIMAPPIVTTPSISQPVAVIKFNGDAIDSTGKISINGAWGIPTYTTDHKGNPNGAMIFDGSDKIQYYDLALKGQSITMAAWVKIPGPSLGAQHFVFAMDAVKGGVTLYQADMSFGSSVSVSGTNSVTSDNNISAGWHHIASTYDGTNIRLYIDGQLTATKNHVGSIGDEKRGLVIGGASNYFWIGTIDELRIYDTVLTKEQVDQVMAL